MKRLLCITGNMDSGGAETFLMKIYRKLDKSKYQIDFLITSKEEGLYKKEILELGGKIYRGAQKSEGIVKYFFDTYKTVKNNRYDYVIRMSQHSIATLDLLIAKLAGAKVLVQRSTNSKISDGKVTNLLHKGFKFLPKYIPNVKIAPASESAIFTFGKECMKNDEVCILNNAIPTDKFIFNLEERGKIRKEFNIEDKFVIGHIGRFNFQKNHSFLIDIFKEISLKKENAILLLVGQGELEEEVKNKVKQLGLENKVIFAGVRKDIPSILMGMDVFLFPSFFEGMPNTVIEAQATDLPCVVADTITREANITNNIEYVSLDLTSNEWANKVLDIKNIGRKNMKELFIEKGYDIESVAKKFVDLIFERGM